MYPGINPRQMRQAMKKMGVQQEDLEAKEVIIKLDDRELVFSNPGVAKVNMMGQESFQITGEYEERELDSGSDVEISEEDIKTVMEQTEVSKEDAKKALEETNGDIAEAILKLKEEE
jgi:nascent polypeptide-associated complex subunit alpha